MVGPIVPSDGLDWNLGLGTDPQNRHIRSILLFTIGYFANILTIGNLCLRVPKLQIADETASMNSGFTSITMSQNCPIHEGSPAGSTETDAEELCISAIDSDDGLVDSTQKLIDEVNQLLGTGGTSTAGAKVDDDAKKVASESEKLKGFLGTLECHRESESDAEAKSDEAEISESMPYMKLGSEDSVCEEPVAQDSSDAVDDDTESGFDIGALKCAFDDNVMDTESSENSMSTELSFMPNDAIREEIAIEVAEAKEKDAAAEDHVDESIAKESSSAMDSVSEASDSEDPAVDNYLDEFKREFEDDSADDLASTEETREEPIKPVTPASTDEEREISVENWLGENVGASEDSPSDQVEKVASENENVSRVQVEDPLAEQSSVNNVESTLQTIESSVDEASALEATPSIRPTSSVDIVEDRVSELETFMSSRLRQLEDVIGGMFRSIDARLDELSSVGVPATEMKGRPEEQICIEKSVDTADSDAGGDEGLAEAPVEITKIDALRAQLTSKLREAEIELSINRAKLSQQRASIEQMQADLERRETAIEAKLEQVKKNGGSASGAEKKRGIMDRWKRHLGDS